MLTYEGTGANPAKCKWDIFILFYFIFLHFFFHWTGVITAHAKRARQFAVRGDDTFTFIYFFYCLIYVAVILSKKSTKSSREPSS